MFNFNSKVLKIVITCYFFFQITQQLEGICLQVIGTVLQQHVLGICTSAGVLLEVHGIGMLFT